MNHRAAAALSCTFLIAAISGAAAAPTPRPSGNAPSPAPASSSSGSIVSSGPAQTRFGDLTVNFSEGEGNLKTGDFVMPSTVTGHSSDGTFRGDRAFGNSKRDEVTLIGHVLVHKLGGVGGNGKKPSEPVTLTCDKLQIYNKRKVYIASGNVKVVQGDKTLTAPLMRLDDETHDAALTGGVHADEPPDRTFDAAEVLYNTKTENFKALGGVQATFPLKSSPTPAPPPSFASPLPSAAASPRAPRPSPAPTRGS
ncbi:MAG TPA: LPS export ABC transporter periplasmic protein LptC [Candidatus Eremiobacteraceae bacterium]|nr:LPS export ABC transporter periplasmic protein LptC [Candidatus Eremiobacteraceae bacterium]